MISLNLKRRHLNESQRMMVAARLSNMKVGQPKKNSANLHNITIEKASDMLNVSRRGTFMAKSILKESPSEVTNIDSGKKTVNEVKRSMEKEDIDTLQV